MGGDAQRYVCSAELIRNSPRALMTGFGAAVDEVSDAAPVAGLSDSELAPLRERLKTLVMSTRRNDDIQLRRQLLQHLDARRPLGEAVPAGVAVVVELKSFDFVYAGSRTAALRAFVARFGTDAPGWVLEHSPISVGANG